MDDQKLYSNKNIWQGYQNAIWDWEMYHTDDEGIL